MWFCDNPKCECHIEVENGMTRLYYFELEKVRPVGTFAESFHWKIHYHQMRFSMAKNKYLKTDIFVVPVLSSVPLIYSDLKHHLCMRFGAKQVHEQIFVDFVPTCSVAVLREVIVNSTRVIQLIAAGDKFVIVSGVDGLEDVRLDAVIQSNQSEPNNFEGHSKSW